VSTLSAHVLFGKPVPTRIKCGAGFFPDMRKAGHSRRCI
jgi:hypothetical protein